MRELIALPVLRFIILGVVNTALSVLLLLLFVMVIGWPYLLAQGAVHLIVVTWAFFPSRAWVFQMKTPIGSGFVKFHLGYLSQLPIAAIVLALCVEVLGMSVAIGQLAAITIAAATNYMTQRFLVFGRSG